MLLLSMDYCKTCAGLTESLLAGGLRVHAALWIEGREYEIEETIEELESRRS